MSTARAGAPGATRVCPHCKAVVLETAAVCPGCRHHLRFNASDVSAAEAYCAFNIEGTIAHKQTSEHCEYCIVLDIRNERGEQIMRQVVGVGALHPGELRRLNLAVEMLPVRAAVAPKNEQPNPRDPRRPGAPAPAPAPGAARAPATSPAPPAPAAPTPGRAPAAAPTPLVPPATKAKSPVTPVPATGAVGGKAQIPPDPTRRAAPERATERPAERPAETSSPLSDRLRQFRKP